MIEIKTISPQEAKEIMDTETGYAIVDVRSADEYAQKHVPGAISLPNEGIGRGDISALPDKNQKILTYCQSGKRSQMACKKMAVLGYTDVSSFGGIAEWPYDTEGQ